MLVLVFIFMGCLSDSIGISSKILGTTKEIGDFNIAFLRHNLSGKQCLVAHLCPVSHRHMKSYCKYTCFLQYATTIVLFYANISSFYVYLLRITYNGSQFDIGCKPSSCPHRRLKNLNKTLIFVDSRPLHKCHNMQQRDSSKSING